MTCWRRRGSGVALAAIALVAPLVSTAAAAPPPPAPPPDAPAAPATTEPSAAAEEQLRGVDELAAADAGGTVTVELLATDDASAEGGTLVELVGGDVVATTPSGTVLAEVPAAALDELVDGATVREPLVLDIRPEGAGTVGGAPELGPVDGGQSQLTGAASWHAAGLDGRGVRIGVIDFFDVPRYWRTDEMGPAPVPGVTARCFDEGRDCTGEFFDGTSRAGDEHGPAVVEVLKEMAPGAEVLIGRASTESDYYALVDWFAANGVRVVTRSLGSRYDGPGDGRGALDSIADHAVSKGILWVNSGGNNALTRYYRSPVRLVGDDVAFGRAGTDTFLRFTDCISPGGVRWANDWDLPPEQRTDYDVFVYESPAGNPAAGTVVAAATARQTSGAPPLESFLGARCPAPGNALYLRIVRIAGDATGDVIEILDYRGGMAAHTQSAYSASTSIVASRNPGVLAAGAVEPGGSAAAYSSRGPTNDERVKPDLAAVSGLPNATYGTFAGTSAAAPTVAGAAALYVQAGLAAGPRELGDLLRNSTVDRDVVGPDTATGTGELRLPAPPSGGVDTSPSRYVPLASPTRILDTRPTSPIGPPQLVGTLWPGEIAELPVAGTAGLPATGVTAVAVNLTIVDALRPGYGQALPTRVAAVGAFSNFNIDQPGQTRPNFAIVPVGPDGSISVYTDTGGHLLVDLLGWFGAAPDAVAAGRFVGLSEPVRVLDTRRDGARTPVGSGGVVSFGVPAGIDPAHVAALVVNVTGTDTNGAGFVQAFPGGRGTDIGRTSTLNLTQGATAANTVVVPVTASGVSLFAELGPGGSAHLIADVTGYVTGPDAPAATAGRFVPVTPGRAFDARRLGPPLDDDRVVETVAAAATGVGAPPSSSGVVLNLTATDTVRYGFARAWASGDPEPGTSALNWSTAGMTIANAAIVRPDAAGRITVRTTDENPGTSGPLAQLLVDVFGYFT